MENKKFQNLFVKNIFSGTFSDDLLSEVIPLKGKTAKEVLNVYRDDYTSRMLEALGERFESCWWVLGDEYFFEYGQDYISRYSSTSYNLSDFGNEFPIYLKSIQDSLELPFLFELAQFEMSFQKLFQQKEEDAIANNLLAEISDIATVKFLFVDNLFLYQSEYCIFNIWNNRKNNQDEVGEIDWNDIEFKCVYKNNGEIFNRSLSKGQFLIFKALLKQETLDQAITEELEAILTESDFSELFSFLANNHLIKSILS